MRLRRCLWCLNQRSEARTLRPAICEATDVLARAEWHCSQWVGRRGMARDVRDLGRLAARLRGLDPAHGVRGILCKLCAFERVEGGAP